MPTCSTPPTAVILHSRHGTQPHGTVGNSGTASLAGEDPHACLGVREADECGRDASQGDRHVHPGQVCPLQGEERFRLDAHRNSEQQVSGKSTLAARSVPSHEWQMRNGMSWRSAGSGQAAWPVLSNASRPWVGHSVCGIQVMQTLQGFYRLPGIRLARATLLLLPKQTAFSAMDCSTACMDKLCRSTVQPDRLPRWDATHQQLQPSAVMTADRTSCALKLLVEGPAEKQSLQ